MRATAEIPGGSQGQQQLVRFSVEGAVAAAASSGRDVGGGSGQQGRSAWRGEHRQMDSRNIGTIAGGRDKIAGACGAPAGAGRCWSPAAGHAWANGRRAAPGSPSGRQGAPGAQRRARTSLERCSHHAKVVLLDGANSKLGGTGGGEEGAGWATVTRRRLLPSAWLHGIPPAWARGAASMPCLLAWRAASACCAAAQHAVSPVHPHQAAHPPSCLAPSCPRLTMSLASTRVPTMRSRTSQPGTIF